MTLATAPETTRPRRLRLRRASDVSLGVDALLMAASLGVCAALFASGGLEAMVFAAAGAVIGARHAVVGSKLQSAYSGGFAGLFVGTLFAACFHDLLVATLQSVLA